MKYIPGVCTLFINENIVDSLSVRNLGPLNNSCYFMFLSDTNNVSIFGLYKKSKYFYMGGYHTAIGKRYTRDFGLTYIIDYFYQPYGYWIYEMVGAAINGVVYGDTNMPTGIN